MASNKPILGYWNLRGIGQPIRLLLTYLEVDFEDKQYELTVENKGAPWTAEKFNLGLDFPNLPYYIDGDVKLTQSLAIMRYLGRKFNVAGSSEQERVAISLVEQQVYDMVMAFARVAYDDNCEKLKVDYLKNLPTSLKQLSAFLGDKPFVAGTNISYVDFWLYEMLFKLTVFVPEVFSKEHYPELANLTKFVERVASLPRVAAYIKASKPALFNGVMAKWNATA